MSSYGEIPNLIRELRNGLYNGKKEDYISVVNEIGNRLNLKKDWNDRTTEIYKNDLSFTDDEYNSILEAKFLPATMDEPYEDGEIYLLKQPLSKGGVRLFSVIKLPTENYYVVYIAIGNKPKIRLSKSGSYEPIWYGSFNHSDHMGWIPRRRHSIDKGDMRYGIKWFGTGELFKLKSGDSKSRTLNFSRRGFQ
tara:strand:- start:1786 stop:2364 length:579 start_codon:yes stop_codon:yes gene_type:complete